MEIIGLISLVRVVQSFLTRLVLTILHNISMGFMSVEFPGQSRTLMPYSSKITSLFLQNDRESNLAEKHPFQL